MRPWLPLMCCGFSATQLRFASRNGEVPACLLGDGIVLEFPLVETAPVADSLPVRGLANSVVAVFSAGEDLLIELANSTAVQNFVPDLGAIAVLPAGGLSLPVQLLAIIVMWILSPVFWRLLQELMRTP
ncbi:hypothetical protein [Zhongshania sp.]|uniref:hypothetical protein n=1 Tax=Zhongshania sp. TaxID=1971902 RepID=UPI00356AF3D2